MANPKRTALLIRCSVEEAELIRAAARRHDRTLSGFILYCLRTHMRMQADLDKKFAAIAEAGKRRVRDSRT